MGSIDMVVFDLAGTTVQDQDGLVAKVFLDVAAAHDIATTPAEIASMRGRSKIEVFRALLARQGAGTGGARGGGDGTLEDRAQAAHADFQSRVLAAYRRACPPVPGAVETFRHL